MKNKDVKFSKFIAYEIDFEYLEENVEFLLDTLEETSKKLSFWEIIKFFSDKKISEPVHASFCKSFNINCENVTYTIHCNNLIARQVLATTLNLKNENRTIWCDWYLYDFNSCNETPQFIHYFFLVGDGEIQLDNVRISTSWVDDYDANILITFDDKPLWSNEEENRKAITLWYYQRFYEETTWGKILTIRENLKLLDSEQDLTSKLLNLKVNSCCSSINQTLLSSINRKLKIGTIILLGTIINKFFNFI